jgi:hypothetical protein
MPTLPADQVAYIVAALSLITGFISIISPYVAKIPAMSDPTIYNNTLRAINFVLNFGAVILLEQLHHTLDWNNILAYVSVAGVAAVGSHVLYRLNTATLRQASSTSTGVNDVKQPR